MGVLLYRHTGVLEGVQCCCLKGSYSPKRLCGTVVGHRKTGYEYQGTCNGVSEDIEELLRN